MIACDETEVKTEKILELPKSKNVLHLPLGWTGEFKGELPRLEAIKSNNSENIKLMVSNPWNADTREGLDNNLRSRFPKNIYVNLADTKFILYIDEKLNLFRMQFHEDESDSYKNRWTWDFYINYEAAMKNDDYICELKSIIVQFVEAYKIKN